MRTAIICNFALAALVIPEIRSQIVSGTIVGTVTDVSSAVISNARITVRSEATGFSRGGVSDSSGNFVFPQLPPGKYRISANAPGFSTYEESDIILLVDQTVR